MTHGKNTLRIIVTAAVAFGIVAPAAQAGDVKVCNQATANSLGGQLNAIDGDHGSPARFTEGLKAHPGRGAGLLNAAAHSRALSACAVPEDDGGNNSLVPGYDS